MSKSAEEKAALIQNFKGVSAVDDARATQFLDAANWDLDAALNSFFESVAAAEPAHPAAEEHDVQFLEAVAASQETKRDSPGAPAPAAAPSAAPAAGPSSNQPKPKAKMSDKKFGTLASLGGNQSGGSDSDGEEGQAFYAGGHESGGGQQVLGPPRRDNPRTEAERLQALAMQQGAAGAAADDGEATSVTMTMWADGFSLDDGPLRDMAAPENAEFMAALKSGKVPRELLVRYGQSVNVQLQNRTGENWRPPPMKAFSGAGNRLGSLVPGPAPVPVAAEPQAPAAAAEKKPMPTLELKTGEPVTRLAVRLADNQRVQLQLNPSHTLADVRAAINRSHGGGEYTFHGGFPPVKLDNESATLADLNLLGAQILQKRG